MSHINNLREDYIKMSKVGGQPYSEIIEETLKALGKDIDERIGYYKKGLEKLNKYSNYYEGHRKLCSDKISAFKEIKQLLNTPSYAVSGGDDCSQNFGMGILGKPVDTCDKCKRWTSSSYHKKNCGDTNNPQERAYSSRGEHTTEARDVGVRVPVSPCSPTELPADSCDKCKRWTCSSYHKKNCVDTWNNKKNESVQTKG